MASIKANELRLGNYIEYDGNTVSVIALAQDDIVVDTYYAGMGSSFSAIPLTEEWVQKLGFKKSKGEFSREWACYYSHGRRRDVFCLEHRDGKFSFGEDGRINIDTVHQLQNYFFAITGEELKVKEKWLA